jgi:hypothetical protein
MSAERGAAAPLPDLPLLRLLRKLGHGEILELQGRAFSIRGNRVTARIARNALQAGLIEPPPDLFAPTSGRITKVGLVKLNALEKFYDK